MTLDKEAIHDRISYHEPSEVGALKHKQLSEVFEKLMEVIVVIVPEGREQSLAFTKIEEAKMWASAGVARNPDTC